MRDLTKSEVQIVSGGLVNSFEEAVEGAVWGFVDGLATGVTIGGSASRTAVFGPIGQLVGVILGGVIGPFACTLLGAMWGKDAVAGYASEFRNQFGTGSDVTLV